MSSPPSKADPEVKKAIEAHRQKTLAANHQISLLNAQIEALNMKYRRSELVEKELEGLPNDVSTYKVCGRMFIQEPKQSIIKNLNIERGKISENIESAQKSRETVTNSLSESKEALRELLSSKQT